MQSLIGGQWIRKHRNLLITGPTGVGTTWIACALAHKACRDGFTAQYRRASRLFDERSYAQADGRYLLLMKKTRSHRRAANRRLGVGQTHRGAAA